MVATLLDHTGAVLHVTYSPDGRQILTTSADHTARLWRSDLGRLAGERSEHDLLATLGGHTAPVVGGEFSPDGRAVITAGSDARAMVFPTTLDGFVALACKALRDYPDDYAEIAGDCP